MGAVRGATPGGRRPGASDNSTADRSAGSETGWPLAAWWRETLLELPPNAPRRWQNVISGDSMETSRSAGGRPND